MASEFFTNLLDYSDKMFAEFFTRFIVAVIILLIGFIIGRLVGKLAQKFLHEIELNNVLKKANIKIKLEEIISHFITYFIYFITVIWALNEMGLTTTILNMISATALIIIIISVLLAVKDFIPNSIAGFMIYQKRLIKEGDCIKLDQLEGKVKKITMLETQIKTKAGDVIHIPNSTITKKEFTVKK